jgi:hypothetical protein
VLTEEEMVEGERGDGVHLSPEIFANALVMTLALAFEAPAHDAVDLDQLFERAVFAEELESDRGRVGRVGVLDVDGDSACELFVHVWAEIVLSGGGATFFTLAVRLLCVWDREVAVLGVLGVVGQLSDRHVMCDIVLAAVGWRVDGDGSLGGHVDDCWVCCD